MSLQTSGWVGHQFDDGVFGGKRVPSDPCFIIIFGRCLSWCQGSSRVLEKETFKSSMTSRVWTKLRSQEKSLIPRMLRYFVQLKI